MPCPRPCLCKVRLSSPSRNWSPVVIWPNLRILVLVNSCSLRRLLAISPTSDLPDKRLGMWARMPSWLVLRVSGSMLCRCHLLLTRFTGVIKDYKAQGLSKAMFSGEGFFVYKVSGIGILWISSLGAIIRKDVSSCCGSYNPGRVSDQNSFKKVKSTSSTTATWLRGTPSTCWNVLRVAE